MKGQPDNEFRGRALKEIVNNGIARMNNPIRFLPITMQKVPLSEARNITMILLSTGMVVVGYLGLIGEIRMSKFLIAALLATIMVISFSLGRQSTRLNRT